MSEHRPTATRRREAIHLSSGAASSSSLSSVRAVDVLATERRLGPRIGTYAPAVPFIIGVVILVIGRQLGVEVLGVVLMVGAGGIAGVNVRVGAPDRVLRSLLRAVRVHEPTDQLTNLLEGLCVGNGIPVPTVHVVEDEAANALVLGWSPSTTTLLVTTGLVGACDRIELEGVLAHELAHVKCGDLRDAAYASVAMGSLALCSSRVARTMQWLLRPHREVLADIGGAQMTRYPPGLLRALEAIDRVGTHRVGRLSSAASRLTAPLWLVNLDDPRPARASLGAFDVAERIALLAEL